MLPSQYITDNKLAMLSPKCLGIIDMLYQNHDIELITQDAYILATIRHETANQYAPVREYGIGRGRPYGNPDPDTGQIYYGRGYVQLTWKANYEKFSKILGIDLVNNPDLALDPGTALKIILDGMKDGTFTGKKLDDYINDSETDYVNARRIINGTDRADLIAGYATSFEPLLRKAYAGADNG